MSVKVYLELFTQGSVVPSEFCLFLFGCLSTYFVTYYCLPAEALLFTAAALAVFAKKGASGLASQLTRRYSERLVLSVVTDVAMQYRKLPGEGSMHTCHAWECRCTSAKGLIVSSCGHGI